MPEVDAAQLEGEAMLSDRIADLVEYLVVQIVDDPDSVSLEVIDGDDASTIEVSVAEDDVAKVIGRRGRTIKAIRTLARCIGRSPRHCCRGRGSGARTLRSQYKNIARVVKPHGRKGEVLAQPLRGLPSVLEPGMRVALTPPALKARPFLHGRVRHRYGRWRSGFV